MAYRYMRVAETGEPIDYHNEPRPVNGTKYLRLLEPQCEWITDEHLVQLRRLPDLVNPDPKAPEYRHNVAIANGSASSP